MISGEGKDSPEDRGEEGVEEMVDRYRRDEVFGLETPDCNALLVFWDPERNGLADGEDDLWQ